MGYNSSLFKKFSEKGYPYRLLNSLDVSSLKNKVINAKQSNSCPKFGISRIEICLTSSCNYRCRFCYGKYLKPRNIPVDNELPIELIRNNILIDIRKNKKFLKQNPIIVLGGLYSEPLFYSKINQLIKLFKRYHFRFGIYTNGFFLNRDIQKIICENAVTYNNNPSYISFNFTSSFIHGNWHSLLEKIKNIVELRNKTHSLLKINVPILILEDSEELLKELEKIQKFLLKIGVDAIRYAFPQEPVRPILPLQARIYKLIDSLKKSGEGHVYIRLPSKPFTRCFVMCMSVAIDSRGDVYPCSQTCTSYFKKLSFGSIARQRFSEIWYSKKHVKLFQEFNPEILNCRCNVLDEQFNRICANFY